MSGPSQEEVARVVAAVGSFEAWFTPQADKVLERLKTETTEDVMLYHDAVSVLVGARTALQAVAHLGEEECAICHARGMHKFDCPERGH